MEVILLILLSLSTADDLPLPDCSVSVEEGETAILPVKVDLAQDSKLSTPRITWKYETKGVVHQYRNEKDYNGSQEERFKGRTSLFKEEIKKGNVSLKIINVTKSDAGKYTCQVLHNDPDIEEIDGVSLCVTERDERGGSMESPKPEQPGQTPKESTKAEQKPIFTLISVIIAIGVLSLAALAAFFLYKKRKEEPKRKDQDGRGDDQEMNTLTGGDPGAGGNKLPINPPEMRTATAPPEHIHRRGWMGPVETAVEI